MSKSLKNVLIVGLGIGGSAAIKALSEKLPSTHRLVVVTNLEFGYWPIGSLRSATVPGWEDKATVPLDRVFPSGSRHILVSGTKVVQLGEGYVTVDRPVPSPLGGTQEIEFDYAIIASGSSYSAPMRSLETDTDISSVKKTFLKFQETVKTSKSILVVGGGATGLEFAAEVASQHPGKQVTIVHSAPSFFNAPGYNPKLGKSLDTQLKNKGVKIVYNSRLNTTGLVTGALPHMTSFPLSNGQQIDANFVFVSTGITPNSGFVKALNPALVNEAGYVKVKPTLQIKTASGTLDNVFVIGDVNDVAEAKTAVAIKSHIPVVVANILALIKSPSTKALKTHSPIKPLILVTNGPDGGAGQLFGMVVGAWFSSKMKARELMVKNFKASYNY